MICPGHAFSGVGHVFYPGGVVKVDNPLFIPLLVAAHRSPYYGELPTRWKTPFGCEIVHPPMICTNLKKIYCLIPFLRFFGPHPRKCLIGRATSFFRLIGRLHVATAHTTVYLYLWSVHVHGTDCNKSPTLHYWYLYLAAGPAPLIVDVRAQYITQCRQTLRHQLWQVIRKFVYIKRKTLLYFTIHVIFASTNRYVQQVVISHGRFTIQNNSCIKPKKFQGHNSLN